MPRKKDTPAGFTLIELIVVLLVIAILASFTYKRMDQTVSRAEALDVASRLVALGLANKRNASDHKGRYVHRRRKRGMLFNCDNAKCLPCNGKVCPSCNLIACKYIDRALVIDNAFFLNAVSPASERKACGLPQPEKGPKIIACASEGNVLKKTDETGNARFKIRYGGWAYSYHTDGDVRAYGGAPVPSGRKSPQGSRASDYD